MVGLHHGRERVEEECTITELAQSDAHPGQCLEVAAHEFRIAHREFHGLRQEEPLRGRLMTGLEPLKHLLEENAFVGRMLVEQHEPAFGFEQHVEAAHNADDSQRPLEQGDGQRTRTRRERGGRQVGMGRVGRVSRRNQVARTRGRYWALGRRGRWSAREGTIGRRRWWDERRFGGSLCRDGIGFGQPRGRSRIGLCSSEFEGRPRGCGDAR